MTQAVFNEMDQVDTLLAQQDGQVQRPRDSKMCNHNSRQKCTHCLPIDPYDEEYLKSKDIKHMSFHAHVKKLTQGHGKGSKLRKPLETIRVKVDRTCDAHQPFPKGVCTRCRPPMMTLNRQRFRHVDNISIENQDVVNDFLDFWRRTGLQRIGYLIGKYETFSDVPLGIKARVLAIYEPPQINQVDKSKLLEDENKEIVDKICGYLGLKRIGWIFTDLWSADAAKGTVHCVRNADSFLLSAEECITAGWLQNQYPNLTEFSMDGKCGSKFVTLVASGDRNLEISFSGYQVSNQCAALVEADVLCPTQFPELAYIRETPLREDHYILDVQFTMKNEYGAEVSKDGRPLPVEYLLVDVPAGMPKEPEYSFHSPPTNKFYIENRHAIGEIQGGQNLVQNCLHFSGNNVLEQISNFHFLLYLANNTVAKCTEDELKQVCEIVRTANREAAAEWAHTSTTWHSLVGMAQYNDASASVGAEKWDCRHCTFKNNETDIECAVCSLPKE